MNKQFFLKTLVVCIAGLSSVLAHGQTDVKALSERASKGAPDAQFALGRYYYDSLQGRTNTAIWYRKAAERGNDDAQSKLGTCYYDGKGVPQDYSEAIKWFRKAAEMRNDEALYWLGVCYANGNGVPKDQAEAVKWYRKAAERGVAAVKRELNATGK